jgi:TonB-linked SusC/RagA family outer membrane protein
MRSFMFKKLLFVAIVVFLAPIAALAQSGSVTGKVTDRTTGEELTGANVLLREINRIAVTNIDGDYTIANIPSGTYTMVVTYVGFRETRRTVQVGTSAVTVNIVLDQDLLGLDEVVITGVSDATPQRMLPFTVNRVGSQDLENVPAGSAAGSLVGKVAGVKITSSSGQPGSTPNIRLRGSTALIGSQQPLIIVDGIVLDGTLADVNSEDIEAIEVIKGASAASLYGSRAANGVIQIITKRGQYLEAGQTQVTIRNEYGVSSLAKKLDLSMNHMYELDASGNYALNAGGNRISRPDQFAVNPYPNGKDLQDALFESGTFYNNFVSVARNTGSGNSSISFTNTQSEGILFGTEGYGRQNLRVNVDQNISDQFRVSVSSAFSQSNQEPVTQGPGSGFFRVLMMSPSADIFGMNPNGQKYRYRADPFVQEPNPLYELEYRENDFRRQRILGDVRATYRPLDWISVEASYGFDRADVRNSQYFPLGYLGFTTVTVQNPEGVIGGDGSLNKFNSQNTAQLAVATATFDREFVPELRSRFRVSYQYENRKYDEFSVTGSKFAVGSIPRLNITDTATRSAGSYQQEIITENIFGLLDLDYRERYIASFLLRQDGSSEFGENERYATYYRASAAYRLTEDFDVPHFDEIKLRASIGTAGLRPGFGAQYETFSVASGSPVPVNLGNPNLKPAYSTETEFGVDLEFLRRFSLQVNYSNKVTEDQIVLVPLSSKAGGFSAQWQNAGTLESNSWEAQLRSINIDTRDISWTTSFVIDRTRQKVTKLDFPSRLVGPGEQSNNVFFLTEGENFGIIYGRRWVRSFEQLQANPAFANADPANYVVNSDGYLVLAANVGTVNERPIRYFALDDTGALQGTFRIGDTNPDFNFGIANNFQWKGFTVYALLDAQIGGDLYNLTKQWIYREARHAEFDQAGKPDSERKSVPYYFGLYDANNANEHFVEDATYLKLRELAINYTFNSRQLGALGNSIDRLRVGIIGRNLLTFTKYSGYDPDVSGLSGDASNYRIDSYNYPSFRTITGVIEIQF